MGFIWAMCNLIVNLFQIITVGVVFIASYVIIGGESNGLLGTIIDTIIGVNDDEAA